MPKGSSDSTFTSAVLTLSLRFKQKPKGMCNKARVIDLVKLCMTIAIYQTDILMNCWPRTLHFLGLAKFL